MYELVYSKIANADLQAIFNYIKADNPEQAILYLGRIEKCIEQLRTFQNIGHKPKYNNLELLGIKILPCDKYLIFYTVDEIKRQVNIVRVLNGVMKYQNLF